MAASLAEAPLFFAEVDVGIEDHDGHGGQHQKALVPSPLLFLPQVLLLVGISGGDHGHHHRHHLP